ncbi:MAG: UDP-N-acetylmuramoyl-tripeptide--D-alanyl-D-alanine ligase [Owenweeksia sp.]|nr:UDP-N-acetylmuramoyl-tripeptide--D-alanyl-D-alanine ligase [Owenweeksia sp.]MBG00423.1 UDP-N-acetylmuramoyl-tripeptide--D-alanyl-D-alanine ligase [Owenweeksia sp.]HBF20872.1 UDP-N-acetylmuramoyl-tripeptide--D-alanyl-D-alanine ligase [Cryomorphaceae bacterium]HCQ16568.1 UDP-N-acetylmuramoyl-tripeptide--D-alanyl-D-alanine ligase [Cryomorphaceae bacterium]|tara:strand:+ start:12383 stop:13660 length:1278 start_codon:yes stop_codon:yes gene_type:complete
MELSDLYDAFVASKGISTDTRSITPGSIFFALKGANFNGNEFAGQALEDGAVLAIIDEEKYSGPNRVLVHNSLDTLQELAKFHRQQLSIPVIGLTGSNGKTTTKELMYAVLCCRYKTLATKGNLNNHIGVPLTLLNIRDEHEMAIIEMGANHQGEIAFLSSICKPDIGYITNFGLAHLEGFGGKEGVIKGKSELYAFLRANQKKVLVNADDPIQMEKTEGLERFTFGMDEKDHDLHFKSINPADPFLALEYEGLAFRSNLTGKYNASNLAAAISIGKYFDVPLDKAQEAIANYHPTNNRSQVQETERNTLVVDAYNANPSSMEAALRNFAEFPGNPKWVILGDMFELGEYEAEEHNRIAKLLTELNLNEAILIGKAFMTTTAGNPTKFETTEALLDYLKQVKPEGCTILIKGSRGMRLERTLEYL